MTESFQKLSWMENQIRLWIPYFHEREARAVLSPRMDFRIKKQRRHNGFMMLWGKIAAKLFFNILSCVLKRSWRKLNECLHTCMSTEKTLRTGVVRDIFISAIGEIKLLMIVIAD